jgi:hypothetical protein
VSRGPSGRFPDERASRGPRRRSSSQDRRRPAATLVAAFAIAFGVALPSGPAAATTSCATGWTEVDGVCELVVSASGDVALPAAATFDVLAVGGGGGGGGAGGKASGSQ